MLTKQIQIRSWESDCGGGAVSQSCTQIALYKQNRLIIVSQQTKSKNVCLQKVIYSDADPCVSAEKKIRNFN